MNETFMMQAGERINKVTCYVAEHHQSYLGKQVRYVRGIQFYTTAGRTSDVYGASEGNAETEFHDGFTLGYVTGRSGSLIDQLQFTWIRRGE
jgi:hypothetical protein